jgi:CCR4-NOT transcription complex subunit 1
MGVFEFKKKWLNDNLSSQRDTLFEASNDLLRNLVQRSGPIVNRSLETIAIFFKVLQANVSQLASRDLAEEMKRLHSATVHVNPRLLSVGASEQSPSEVFAADIEEEANSYFQQTYIGQLTIDDVMLDPVLAFRKELHDSPWSCSFPERKAF